MRDRDLVVLHWPPPLRPAFDTLLALDDRLAEVALGAREPALGAIKLAWWRDQLAALDTQPPPPEPVLASVAALLLPRGLTGEELSGLADAWMSVLDEEPSAEPRGRALFRLLGLLLGTQVPGGEAFARADLARRTGEAGWLRPPAPGGGRVPSAARPATLLDALGRRDSARPWPPEPEATPGRSWTLLRHRLTGR
jgi:15-cis-phytoene synthase